MSTERIFKFIGIAAIIFLVFGLGGWYLFLRQQSGQIQSLGDARGFESSIPSFLGSRGSTVSNILSDLGFGDPAPAESTRPPRLWKVNASPVAGAAFVTSSTTTATSSSMTLLRFVERSTGHVFDANPETGDVRRLTNTLKSPTYEAYLTSGNGVISRTLDADQSTIVTFSGIISTTTEDGYSQLIGGELASNILSISTLPFLSDVLYMVREAAGTTALIQSKLDGSSPKRRASFNVGNWSLQWLADGTVVLSEKPASGIVGSAYTLSKSDELVPVVRSIPGLMVLPQSTSTAVIYSSDDGEMVRLFVQPKRNTSTIELPIKTVAAKCVWNPIDELEAYCAVPESLPPTFTDRWFRGEVHTNDVWWVIDGIAGSADKMYAPTEDTRIDVENPTIDMQGKYISFMNATDKSLWLLRVEE